jgi:hypothetical protein
MQRIRGPAMTGRTVAAAVIALAIATPAIAAHASGGTGKPTATAAGRETLVENAHLKFAGERGSAIDEHGEASGTYDAPVAVALTIHPKSVTASVTIYPSGGSISGFANANYIVKGSYGYFGGTFTLTHGTGKFSHISEIDRKPLGISGRINRNNFAMEVKAHGEANL